MQTRIIRLVFLAGLAATPAKVHATGLTWANVAGGPASLATNWSPNQLPASTDDLTFNMVANYGVSYNSSVPTSRTHLYKKGTVTLTASSPHTVSNGIVVGESSGDNATLTVTSGTVTANAASTIGVASGSAGVLNVNSSTAAVIFGSNLFVGTAGAGTMNVTNLGHVQVLGNFLPGTNPTGVGNTTVSGFNASPPLGNSFLEILGLAESRIGQNGSATLLVSSGAMASFAGKLVVAHGSSSTSSVTVQTAGLFDARLSVASDMLVGRNTTATPAGNGTLTINAGGAATVGGTLFVGGDPEGGLGVLNVSGGTLTTDSLIVHDTQGALNHTGGIIIVDGGTFDPPGIALTVNSTSGSPRIKLQSGATTSLAGIGFGLRVATTGLGQFDVLGPGSFMSVSGPTTVGDSAGSSGTLLMNAGGASQLGALTVGNAGNALLIVGGGSTLNSSTVILGAQTNGSGLASVGGEWTINGDALVGGIAAGPRGIGTLRADSSGLIHITGDAIVWNGGSLEVDDATLTVDGVVTLRGPGTMTNGTMNVGFLEVFGSALSASGVINGIVACDGAASSITATGDLTMGEPTSTSGFISLGTLAVGSHTVTLLDSNLANIHDTTIGAGGSLIAANGFQLAAGHTLTGISCTVDADVENQGAIVSAGSGITFKGIVSGIGEGISGATTHYLQGGGFTGAGTIATTIDADAQSVFTATGSLSMGNPTNNFGVTMNGTIHCQGTSVHLLDANGVGLGILTDMNGGSINCLQNLTVNAGRIIEGRGSVSTPNLTINGTINPGDTQALGVQTAGMQVFGNLVFGGVNAQYNCQLAPFSDTAQHDRISATGNATLTGNLAVSLVPDFTPNPRETFDIVTAASVVGKFTTQTLPSGGAFGPVHVVYSPTRVTVVMCYANCDGSAVTPVLNANDFQCFLNHFASSNTYANCDGSTVTPVLNANDFQCFLNKFASGCP